MALILIVIGMLGWAMWKQSGQQPPTMREIVEALRSDKVNLSITNQIGVMMSVMETSWTSARGNHTLKSTRKEDETEAAFAARHAAELAAQQAQFPPVP